MSPPGWAVENSKASIVNNNRNYASLKIDGLLAGAGSIPVKPGFVLMNHHESDVLFIGRRAQHTAAFDTRYQCGKSTWNDLSPNGSREVLLVTQTESPFLAKGPRVPCRRILWSCGNYPGENTLCIMELPSDFSCGCIGAVHVPYGTKKMHGTSRYKYSWYNNGDCKKKRSAIFMGPKKWRLGYGNLKSAPTKIGRYFGFWDQNCP